MKITMRVQLSIVFLFVSIAFTTAFVCPTSNGTYPHEWNKEAYYRCSSDLCAYQQNCPPNNYYSSTTNQCSLRPTDWNPLFDLTGRYTYPNSYIFIEIRQAGYDVQWISETSDTIYTFVGQYVNETMVTGLETRLVKATNCVNLQELDLSVTGKRNFCRSRVSFHWYTRDCGATLSALSCHVY